MRKIFLLSVLILFISCNSYAGVIFIPGNIIVSGSGGAPANCPAWGTYGTATGNIIFAWDGSHPSGQLYACESDESSNLGVNTGGVISGAGANTTFDMDADDDRLEWAVTSTEIDHDAAAGLTVCIEFKIVSMTGNQILWEFEGDIQNLAYVRLNTTGPNAWVYYEANNVLDNNNTGTITDDGSTYNVVGHSWKVAEAGNDMSVSIDGGSTWPTPDDDDLLGWVTPEDAIRIGNLLIGGSTDATSIRRFAVIGGFEQTCPF